MTLEKIYELVEQHNELERIFGGKFVAIELKIGNSSAKQSMEYEAMVERIYKVHGKELGDAILNCDGYRVNSASPILFNGEYVNVYVKSVER